MKNQITARFNDSETAQYVTTYLDALYNTSCDMYTTQISDGYYSYSAIVPFSVHGANYLTNIFCPVFPENCTVDEIENRHGVTVKLRCRQTDTPEVVRYIIKNGGSIIQ